MMEEAQDGRVEDGTAMDCEVCGIHTHLYEEDEQICPSCQSGGWAWRKAMYVRRGDHILLHKDESFEVDAEEDFGLRKAIHLTDGTTLMRRQTTPVLVQK